MFSFFCACDFFNEFAVHLLAVRSIIIPHHTDQPHPTRQNINVNACARPTKVFTKNEPIRARAPSCCENLGMPKHKQNIPEKRVPNGGKIEMLHGFPTHTHTLTHL